MTDGVLTNHSTVRHRQMLTILASAFGDRSLELVGSWHVSFAAGLAVRDIGKIIGVVGSG